MDDWEELNVDDLKLNDVPSTENDDSKVVVNPSESENNAGTPPLSNSNGSPPGLYVNMEFGNASGIPSTLLDALTTPKERFHALKIEDQIVKFLKSNDTATEISPGSNSFQRLLTYRIAQRMCVSHTTLSNDNSGSFNSIQLFKTTESYIPRVLLATVSAPTSTSPPAASRVDNGNSSATIVRPKLMMRNPNKSIKDGNKCEKNNAKGPVLLKKPSEPDLSQTSESTDDVESRYAAAKARIFGVGSDGGSSNANADTSNTTTDSSPLPSVPGRNDASKSNSNPALPTPPVDQQKLQAGANEKQSVLYNYKKEKRVVNVSQDWDLKNNSNSTMRDKDKEKYDPDFARNPTAFNPGHGGAAGYGTLPYSSYNQQPQYSQNYPSQGPGQEFYLRNSASYNASGYMPYYNGPQVYTPGRYDNANMYQPPQQSYPNQAQYSHNQYAYTGNTQSSGYAYNIQEDFPSLGGNNDDGQKGKPGGH